MDQIAFDNNLYLDLQFKAFDKKQKENRGLTFFEFGGKPFGDNHAARVLPGYDPDLKAKLLHKLEKIAKIVIALNARDILSYPYGRTLKGRVRGDSGLRYDDEVIRLISESKSKGFKISETVLTCVPRNTNKIIKTEIDDFRKKLKQINIPLKINFEIDGYPDPKSIKNFDLVFSDNDRVVENENLVVVSPGGGSGKFGLILSEIYFSIKSGTNPNFIKFETFPVFNLGSHHPLNLAFEAATADLKNKVKDIEGGTNFNKDIENFILLKRLLKNMRYKGTLSKLKSPLDWGVNVIDKGIIDPSLIATACRDEIIRRKERYKKEIVEGVEKDLTLDRVNRIIKEFDRLYLWVVNRNSFQYFIGIPLPKEEDKFLNFLKQQFNPKNRLSSPAHITLIPPFEYTNEISLINNLKDFCKKQKTFFVSFKKINNFIQPKYGTVFLAPEDSKDMYILYNNLVRTFSFFPKSGKFVPHLTIANRIPFEKIDEIKKQLNDMYISLELKVNRIMIYRKTKNESWKELIKIFF